MAEAQGWTLYEHPAFTAQLAKLEALVEQRKARDPTGYAQSADAKLLAAIVRLTMEIIPADPGAKAFRQGGTLGSRRKHWFRARFGNGRYRLFYQFSSRARIIIYAWVNDEETLRTYGSRVDAYAVFRSMLDAGNPPDGWDELLKGARDEAADAPKKRKAGKTRRRGK